MVGSLLHVSTAYVVIFRPFVQRKCASYSLVCSCGYWELSLEYLL